METGVNDLFNLSGILITIISAIIGISYTVIKVTALKGNDKYDVKINDLDTRRAVQEEKINGIQSDVKDIKEDVKDLRKDLDEIKNLIIKGIKENNDRPNS